MSRVLAFIRKKAKPQMLLQLLLVVVVLLLLLLPALVTELLEHPVLATLKRLFISTSFLLIPLVFFYRNLRLYLYVLLLWIVFSPLFIYAMVLYEVRPGFDLFFWIFQTNPTEARELVSGYVGLYVFFTLLYLSVYLYAVKKLQYNRLPFKVALAASLLGAFNVGYMFHKKVYRQNEDKYEFFGRYYPASVVSGFLEAYFFMRGNNLEQAKNFSFHAFKKDHPAQRQLNVLVIGESSRYLSWQVNGYGRPTSPRLLQREDLVVFPHAVAGANITALSVPQIITRTTPDEMELRFREKSLLSAFKDAGFKTVWLSNQSDQEIFWAGITVSHAKTADLSIFSTSYSPLFDQIGVDGRLLPLMDSILSSSNDNLFIVLHTIGNHWDYSKRYPQEFDYFQPSGYTRPALYAQADKTVMTNTYNNSIRYADFIIDSVIGLVKKQNAIASVVYVADHGEDVYDTEPTKLKQHTHTSWATLHIPLFVWTSERFEKTYPQKRAALENNHLKKVGSENPFYTLLDLSNISFPGFDSTKSMVSPVFRESRQRYYDNFKHRAFSFQDLKKE